VYGNKDLHPVPLDLYFGVVKGRLRMRRKIGWSLDLVEYIAPAFYARYIEAFSCWIDPSQAIMHFTFKQACANVRCELPYNGERQGYEKTENKTIE